MRWRKAALVRGENEGGAAVDKDYLALMRTALSRQSDEWNVDNFDVLADDEIVGRIFEANAALTGSPWLWTFIFPHEGRSSTHRYEPTHEAAMAGRSSHGLAKRQKNAPSVP